MCGTVKVHEYLYSTSMTSVARMGNGGAYKKGGAYWNRGA